MENRRPLYKDVDMTTIYEMKDDMKMSNKEIANKLDCNPTTIANYVGRRHWNRCPDVETLIRLRKEGFTVKELAARFDVAEATIYRNLKIYKETHPEPEKEPEVEPEERYDTQDLKTGVWTSELRFIRYEHRTFIASLDEDNKLTVIKTKSKMTKDELYDMIEALKYIYAEMKHG